MGINNKSNFENRTTMFQVLFDEVFLGQQETMYELYTDSRSITGNTAFEFNFLNDLPESRQWDGEKEFRSTRANKHRIPVKDYEASTAVSKIDWNHDPEGVGSTLRSWMSAANGYLNKIVVAKFLRGDTDTGYDGVSMFSTAHPNGPAGSEQSNRVATTFSQAAYRVAKSTMKNLKGPSGRPLQITPNLLLVGPNNEDEALDVLEASTRLQSIAADGTLDGGTRVAAASIENIQVGDGVRIIVEPRITGGVDGAGADTSEYWFLIDSSKSPMILAIAQAPNAQDDTNEFLDKTADYHFSIEAQLAVGYGLWQYVYAGLATS